MLVMIFMPPGVPANCQHGWEIPELNDEMSIESYKLK